MTKNRTLGRCSAGNARGSGYVDCKRRSKPVMAKHSSVESSGENGKISTIVVTTLGAQLLADCIVTAELEGDRVMGNARRATRQCSDRGDYAEIGRLRRSALCTVHLLQCISFNTILD